MREAGKRRRTIAQSSGSGTARVFFALWPDQPLRRQLAMWAGTAAQECGGRTMRTENLHLTLVFVGNVARERLPLLHEIAASLAMPDVKFDVDRIGCWRHNHIVWAAPAVVPQALPRFVAGMEAALRDTGFALDERPYVPHVTLVRNARRGPAAESIGPARWEAGRFVLVESVSGKNGVRYDVVGEWGTKRKG
jgi:2'-5' RNA ligase